MTDIPIIDKVLGGILFLALGCAVFAIPGISDEVRLVTIILFVVLIGILIWYRSGNFIIKAGIRRVFAFLFGMMIMYYGLNTLSSGIYPGILYLGVATLFFVEAAGFFGV